MKIAFPIVLAAGLASFVPQSSGARPPSAPLQSPASKKNFSEALEAIRSKIGVPGLVAMALQDGETAAWGAAGVRALGSQDPIAIGDRMHLGSCGKAMTATLVARLVEDGVLDWDTTLAEAMPEFAEKIHGGFGGVTIEQLLQHRGGIAERRRPEIQALHLLLRTLKGSPREVRLAILEKVLSPPPLPPEEGSFDYSNFGYMTAAAMVERILDRPYEELIVEKLFEPMGMESAGVGSPAGEAVAVGHMPRGEGWKPLPPGPGGALPDAMAPAGLLHCNLADWGRFVADHMAGFRGEDGFVTAKSYARLHHDPESSGYACGWGIAKHTWSWGEGTLLAHDGSDNTWYSIVFALPELDLVVLAVTNGGGPKAQQATSAARDLLLTELGFRD